jgi:chromosomal replication initiation ATPase DnaA
MFIGNAQQYARLESWISKPEIVGEKLDYKHICIIIGDSGVGKSYGIQTALNSSSKKIYKVNDLECTNSKDFKDLLSKITSSHVISQFEQTSNKDKIIWIDDFDSFIIYDRRFLHTLEDILDSNTIPAIKIIISTTFQISFLL